MDLNPADWRTGTRSSGNGQCVEVAMNLAEGVAVRDTKDRDGGTLLLTRANWAGFTQAVREGGPHLPV